MAVKTERVCAPHHQLQEAGPSAPKSLRLPLSLLTAIVPRKPGLAGFIGAKDDGIGGDWSYKTCKAPVKPSSPTNQHPTFHSPDALPAPNQQCQSTEGNSRESLCTAMPFDPEPLNSP